MSGGVRVHPAVEKRIQATLQLVSDAAEKMNRNDAERSAQFALALTKVNAVEAKAKRVVAQAEEAEARLRGIPTQRVRRLLDATVHLLARVGVLAILFKVLWVVIVRW